MVPIEFLKGRTVFDEETECWVWTAATTRSGYGQLHYGKNHYQAHRASFETAVGPIVEGMEIDHLCRKRKCINPQHLDMVTPEENRRRQVNVCGERSHLAKMTEAQANHIKSVAWRSREWGFGKRLAEELGVSENSIRMIWGKKSWKTEKVVIAELGAAIDRYANHPRMRFLVQQLANEDARKYEEKMNVPGCMPVLKEYP